MKHLFLVEDDREIAGNLSLLLQAEGYEVSHAYGQAEAAAMLEKETYDLALVDISLPDGNGFAVCTQIRQVQKIPVIFLTASDDEASVVTGLKIGADDYITKPFRPRELTARIQSVLRRTGSAPAVHEICGLLVDTGSGLVKKHGREIFLSALEYRLLLIFLSSPQSVITRDRLLGELWDAAGEYVNDNTLTVYIKRLREKIEEDPAHPQIILTVRGPDTGWEEKMLRNREIRLFTIGYLVLTAASAAAGAALAGSAAGLLVIFLAVCYGAAFFLFTKERYRRIARMSRQIDQVLHDEDCLYLAEEEEGELSILQSEIGKMTLRIREQNRALQREKEQMAESLADIAHQIRTPLTSVNLILSLLENDPEKDRRRELLREEEELLIRVDGLITSLLKLSRLDAGIVAFQNVTVKVRELADSALQPLLIALDLHDVSVRVRIPEGLRLFGDPAWLSQALQNILKNCMESAGDHGWIEILCEDTPLFTEIRIHDSGPGFDEEELHFLFDRFYRGKKEQSSGYGIGLALCRSIITRQGGTVTAKNHPEGGAVFFIRFPK